MADDDEDDRLLALDALKEGRVLNNLHCVEDGVELLEYLRREGKFADPATSPRPSLILLDLNMPRMDERRGRYDPRLRPRRSLLHYQTGQL
jgi:CheY-like chemotaxis protein